MTLCTLNMVHAQKLRILTYNIHHARNESGVVDVPTLARYIHEQQADIVALQEVDSMCNRSGRIDIMQELGRLTGMYYYFGKAMNYDGGGYGEGLLCRWPILNIATLQLPTDPALSSEPRSAIEATVLINGKRPFKFIATHLDHLDDEKDRMLQTKFLAERYKEEKMPFILAGDMNALPDSKPMEQLLSIADIPRHDDLQPTWPSKKPTLKIDYILFSKNGGWRSLRFKVLNEDHISDHRPVMAEVAF
ncbi:MAG TPA: endonuclease/exonuclease/phosphatase family protein [Phnomibacter sp.]|nr:endonuclease/exonuclease/phosphatase family protein [Phnomibacter sp.]